MFDGIRIVDLSQVAAGPYGISLMGDMGADVIKVEPPAGESFRTIDNMIAPGESGYFYGINRSKRAITVNLATDKGREILEQLVRTADVLFSRSGRTRSSVWGLDTSSWPRSTPS